MERIKKFVMKMKALFIALLTAGVVIVFPFIQTANQGCRGSCNSCGGSCLASIAGITGIGAGAYLISRLGNKKKKQDNKNEKL